MKATESILDKRAMSSEDTQLRTEIFVNAINQAKHSIRRDTQLTNSIVASCQTLQALQHPLSYHLMSDLAYNLGKDAFTKACKMVGAEVPPAVEQKARKARIVSNKKAA